MIKNGLLFNLSSVKVSLYYTRNLPHHGCFIGINNSQLYYVSSLKASPSYTGIMTGSLGSIPARYLAVKQIITYIFKPLIQYIVLTWLSMFLCFNSKMFVSLIHNMVVFITWSKSDWLSNHRGVRKFD